MRFDTITINLKSNKMKEETKRILEKAQAGDAEAQYLTGLYYEDEGNATRLSYGMNGRLRRDSYMESTPLPCIT